MSTTKKNSTEFQANLDFALNQDKKDPLRPFQEEFWFPLSQNPKNIHDSPPTREKKPRLYFAGHSLGLQPKKAKDFLEKELLMWKEKAVNAHFGLGQPEQDRPWISYHTLLEKNLARLLGAKEQEVCIMNSLTLNLHLMMVSFYRPTQHKHKILLLADEFSSDRYAVMSHLSFRGYSPSSSLLLLSPRPQEIGYRHEDLINCIETHGNEVALILMGNVHYLTGQAFDMKDIIKRGHEKDCIVGFDLAHGVGNLNLSLHKEGPDFAVWCSYKYLNGGPGAVGGCFVHQRHLEHKNLSRLTGWWGHEESTRFHMPFHFRPPLNANAWQISNPPIFQMAALRASLDIFERATIKSIRKKARLLTSFLEFLMQYKLSDRVHILTPSSPEQRGSQLSFVLAGKNGKEKSHILRLQKALKEKDVFLDVRKGHIFRVTPAPLYCRFSDVYWFVHVLEEALEEA